MTKVFPTRWCPLPLLKKTPFPYEFYVESLVNDKAYKKDQNTEKKFENRINRFKMVGEKNLCSVQNFPAKI